MVIKGAARGGRAPSVWGWARGCGQFTLQNPGSLSKQRVFLRGGYEWAENAGFSEIL